MRAIGNLRECPNCKKKLLDTIDNKTFFCLNYECDHTDTEAEEMK